MLKKMLEQVKSPGTEFRGAPFWAWNAKLEPEELRRQIRVMKEMGLGGFFMHSRVGLNTEYLGDEWFNCIKACVDEAELLQMDAWLYDEDRWPSGAAGGIVTQDPQYRIRAIRMACGERIAEISVPANQILGCFAAVVNGETISNCRVLSSVEDALESGETKLCFFWESSGTSSWFNNQTYLDTLNEEAVRRFIEVTHEIYAGRVGETFGKCIKGIFTDEPSMDNFQFDTDFPSLPWTGVIPQRFQEKYGYDLIPHLPELFLMSAGEDFSKARLDYYNLVTELFVNAFSRQIGEWCEEHQLRFTGHVLCEDDVVNQRHAVGAAMRFYEYMQMPGIDLLTEHWSIYDTAKQCTSMAHQFGRQWRLSETYGCTGWDFPFFGHKQLGDWQFALGINFRCQHLAWYSMEAEAKRDYPASISFQSPWYRQYHVVEEYFGRLGAALSAGEESRPLLVIHPIESTWGWKPQPILTEKDHQEEAECLIGVRNALLRVNLDFDYGDEDVLARHGAVESGLFRVAQASYRAVLLPPMRTIRRSTLAFLMEFRRQGGCVAYCGSAPAYVDGVRSMEAVEAYAGFMAAGKEDFDRVLGDAVREVSIRDREGREVEPVLFQIRRGEQFQVLFCCNTGRMLSDNQFNEPLVREAKIAFESVDISLVSSGEGELYELDLTTGRWFKVASRVEGGQRMFRTSFAELGSRLFLETTELIVAEEASAETGHGAVLMTFSERDWAVQLDEPNVLVLDHWRFRVDGEVLSEPCYVLTMDDRLRGMLGKRARGGAMVQPWLQPKDRKPERILDLEIVYEFGCAEIPASGIMLALERPELYQITLNGTSVPTVDCGMWVDPAIRCVSLPQHALREGMNELRLSCDYHEYLPGLEAMYLLGAFGVDDQTLTALPTTLVLGDWCEQRLPNYAGNVIYHTIFDWNGEAGSAPVLELGDWRGAALGVSVNGSPVKILPWAPYRVELDSLLRHGENELAITVYGHRRNAMGPFYLNDKWPAWTGPEQFKLYEIAEKQLVPCGLMNPPRVIG